MKLFVAGRPETTFGVRFQIHQRVLRTELFQFIMRHFQPKQMQLSLHCLSISSVLMIYTAYI